MIDKHHGWNLSYKPAVLGFVVSLLLIAAMYRLGTKYHLTGWTFTATVISLGIAQALVQLVFFLHVGMDSKPHWNTLGMVFTTLVILIVVLGSLWIMNNLSYNLMPPMPSHGAF